MQYIEGKDIYTLKYKLNPDDFEQIAMQIAYINQINYKPQFIYDSWAIESFNKEFKKFNHSKIAPNILLKIKKWQKLFDGVKLNSLPQSFIHGDVVDMNIVKSGKKLYIVDFSSANYQTRISDIATSIADLCFVAGDIKQTQSNMASFVRAYQKVQPLESYEKQTLIIFVAMASIIGYLNCLKNRGEYNKQLKQKYIDNLILLESIKTL